MPGVTMNREEALMRQALARIAGNDPSRDAGNRFSAINRERLSACSSSSARVGGRPPPAELHARKLAAAAKAKVNGRVTNSQRAVAVPAVGVARRPPAAAAVTLIPKRKSAAEIYHEQGGYAAPRAPRSIGTYDSSDDRRAALAERNSYYGRTRAQVLSGAPPRGESILG